MSKDNVTKIAKVKIELDGEVHNVACTMGVLVRYQLMTGRNVFKKEDMQNMSPVDYIKFLACALYKENPEQYVANLSEKVNGMAVQSVLEIVSKIFEQGEVASDEKKS